MERFRIKKRSVVYKSRDEIQISPQTIDKINSGVVNNLLRIESANSREVIYSINDYVLLKDYLKTKMSLDQMYSIISQTIITLNALSDEDMSNTRLVLDYEYVFVEPQSGALFFIYEPYISKRENIICNNFWINIIDSTKIKDVTAREQCLQLKQYLEASTDRGLDEIYAYVNKTPIENNAFSTGELLVKATNLRNTSFNENDLEPETGLLQDNKPKEVVKQNTASPRKKRAFLIRESKKEKIEVLNDSFVVGKSASCNYTVIGNPTISRRHIIISRKQGEFYLVDEKSTNGTYINGSIIERNREYKLTNGDMLRLSNEDFMVEII